VSTEAVVVAKADETAKPVPAEPVSAEPALAEPALDAANLPETQATPTDAAKTTEVTPEVAAPTVAEATPSVAAVVEETATPEVAVAPAPPVTITVQPGFTLWRIAQDQLGQGIMYVQVFEANQGKITDPDLIYPGQIFTIPKLAE
jgi:nucleoid-associated protein YgaU